VAVLSQSVTGGSISIGANGQTLVQPPILNRTIDPTFRPGLATAANGFGGGGPTQILDPFRVRLNALYQNGNVRLLSRPNLTAVEGSTAQITIGGERPVPSAIATGQAVGQTIVFRRFGIILTMRPTLTDDDTIILQIRADISELADEFGVTLNGARVPGERVRSVDTTMTLREGDTMVLGGLITNERRQLTSRIPILSSLPIIGSLFQSKRFENNESELAIFLTPRIDRTATTVNTKEAVQRVPALPPLPTNDQATGVFGLGSPGGG
jgi:Flp pilus assembly secretin CpaC